MIVDVGGHHFSALASRRTRWKLTTINRIVTAGETRGPYVIARDYIAHITRLAVKDIGCERRSR
jgi:hypothetical protein